MTPQLCLGTAQFGLAYGITNASGQVAEDVVAQLLAQAAGAGIRWLDTAQAYGNAEAVLGRQMPATHPFRLISKLPAQPQPVFNPQDAQPWEEAFLASCQRLGVQRFEALLLHAPADPFSCRPRHHTFSNQRRSVVCCWRFPRQSSAPNSRR